MGLFSLPFCDWYLPWVYYIYIPVDEGGAEHGQRVLERKRLKEGVPPDGGQAPFAATPLVHVLAVWRRRGLRQQCPWGGGGGLLSGGCRHLRHAAAAAVLRQPTAPSPATHADPRTCEYFHL
eukprot:1582810-Pyramimonas_sp.AAC.1